MINKPYVKYPILYGLARGVEHVLSNNEFPFVDVVPDGYVNKTNKIIDEQKRKNQTLLKQNDSIKTKYNELINDYNSQLFRRGYPSE